MCLVKGRVVFVHDHEDQVKYLQPTDDPCDADEEDGRGKQRDGNVEKLFDAVGAVNISSFIVIPRDFLKAGKE